MVLLLKPNESRPCWHNLILHLFGGVFVQHFVRLSKHLKSKLIPDVTIYLFSLTAASSQSSFIWRVHPWKYSCSRLHVASRVKPRAG